MTLEVGGAGSLGLEFEAVLGTYLAPTKFIPIRSESLQKVEDKQYRMNIRGLAERSGAIQGYFHIEGDVEFEVTHDSLLYFLYLGRFTPAKSGAGPYTYTFTPATVAKTTTAAGATTRKTASILIERSDLGRGYVGMSASQYAFTLDNGVLICTVSMLGVDEASQSLVAPVWPSSEPYGPGKVSVEIPDATPRTDADTFSLTINDNGTAANRLDGQRRPSYITWGEREITASMEHDFESLTDYNAFVNQTLQAVDFTASRNASNDQVKILLNAAVADSYQVNLSSLGDVIRGSVAYHGIYNSGDAISIEVKTTENIT